MNRSETETITDLHRQAFGKEEGTEVANLAEAFLGLPDTVSINVQRGGTLAGNVLFTPFAFQDHPDTVCYLLAPCGVLPGYQGQGVGKELMETGITKLKSLGADAVFVLGVPGFYPRYGFAPTDKQTPYPDLLTIPESWMALELTEGSLQLLSGKTVAVEPIMRPEFWDTSAYG
ncbi:MAG: GNAT family N-acetyltransferase [Leisingera sp.]